MTSSTTPVRGDRSVDSASTLIRFPTSSFMSSPPIRLVEVIPPTAGMMSARVLKPSELSGGIATDVASRLIDVEDITHVINFDAPEDRDVYVYRTGRTRRAGASGVVAAHGSTGVQDSRAAGGRGDHARR